MAIVKNFNISVYMYQNCIAKQQGKEHKIKNKKQIGLQQFEPLSFEFQGCRLKISADPN